MGACLRLTTRLILLTEVSMQLTQSRHPDIHQRVGILQLGLNVQVDIPSPEIVVYPGHEQPDISGRSKLLMQHCGDQVALFCRQSHPTDLLRVFDSINPGACTPQCQNGTRALPAKLHRTHCSPGIPP
jgi:hypothetical protein